MIPPKNKKKFGRKKTGKNKKSPIDQVNTINASNATPLIPQRPTIEEDDLAAGVEIQELTTTQILRKARDILQIKENQTEKTPELQSKIGQPQQHKDQVIASMIK